MRIAHLSDPHINLKFHPQHLPRLRRTLEDALARGADHIVISGDITSNADIRDLRTARRLFETLGILKSSKLTIVPGNHDIYGGPQIADDILTFPERCSRCNTAEQRAIFQENFAELFQDTMSLHGVAYPFLKRLKDVAFIGLDTNAEYSLVRNPVGSNGEVTRSAGQQIEQLAGFHAWQTAKHRIVVMHHHLFHRRDLARIGAAPARGLAAMIEHRTLQLHGKQNVQKLLRRISTDLVLHGHVHFTAGYDHHGITCLNGAGAVYPARKQDGYKYNLIDLSTRGTSISVIQVRKPAESAATPTRAETTIPSCEDNPIVMVGA